VGAVERGELLRRAALGQVAGEQDQVERAGLVVQIAEVALERGLDARQQEIQFALALVEIGDMQPRERHGSSHRANYTRRALRASPARRRGRQGRESAYLPRFATGARRRATAERSRRPRRGSR
jgi:hypothetical protein